MQQCLAGVSAYAGTQIGLVASVVIPVPIVGAVAGIVIGAIVGATIGTTLSKAFWNVAGAIHLNPGETQTLNAAEDQLWKFAKLGIKEVDSNGIEKTVLKDAIYVTNADGVTLNKQAMLEGRSVFRVFNGTVATDTLKANFKPLYLLGGKAADNIIGNDDSETIYGYDGSDFLDGRGGNNSIFAGAGNDVVLAGTGRNLIDAGDGDDFVEVEGGNNVIILGKGDDRLYAGGGNDIINAGEGSDVIQAGHGDNIIILGNPTLADDGTIISDSDLSRNEVYAGYGRDNITGSGGRDVIVGDYLDNKGIVVLNNFGDAQVRSMGYMNDTIKAGSGGDLVMGGLGQDTIYGGKGNDVLIGGSDLLDYSLLKFVPSDVDFIYGEAGDDIIMGDSIDDFNTEEYVNYGTAEFNANLIDDGQGRVTYTQDYLDGGIGNDYIDGGDSQDTIIGGLGQDVLYGGRKADTITDGEGNDFIIGGIGNDILNSVGDNQNDFFMFGATDGSDIIKGANKYDDIYFNANLRNNAIFKREGNNLVISINTTDGTKVTVENHFNGNAINSVVFGNNTRYSLADKTSLGTINGGTLNPTYLNNNSSNRFVQLDYRIKEFEADYKDGTSAFAVNEYSTWYDTNYYTATSDSNIDAETFNGIQIGYEKRKRGWFGGHYSVFKQVKNSVLNGTFFEQVERESLNGYFHYTVTANYDEFNDLIVGAWWGETIKGLDGDDIIFAGVGNDSVEGGDGNDFINGGDGNDVLTGDDATSSNYESRYEYNRPYGSMQWYNYKEFFLTELETSHDLIFGGGGNDTIGGGFGNDTLYGDSGNDVINGDTGDDNIDGGSGNDIITDTISYAIIDGGSGDDKVISGNFEDLLWGGEGNDTIKSGGGDDVIFADEGNDYINLGSGTDFAHGGDGNDVILGEADNDIIHGGDGVDALYGGLGSNMLIGGYDNDILYSTGKDILIGGFGNDAVSYYYETAGVMINLSGDTPVYDGKAKDDIFDSIAIYHGSNYNDVLVASKKGTDFRGYAGDDIITGENGEDNFKGDDGNDTIRGYGGSDYLYGGNGNDKIYAGNGDDKSYGEKGNDILYFGLGAQTADGGEGIDSLVYIYSQTGVNINLGTQMVSGGEASDDIITGFENAYSSNYNDIIYGTSGINTLSGYAGNDVLQGYSGNDVLNGGAGADKIDGGLGIDTLSYYDSDAAVRIDLDLEICSGGYAEGDIILNIENVNVSNWNDNVIGNDFNNIFMSRGVIKKCLEKIIEFVNQGTLCLKTKLIDVLWCRATFFKHI
jgi:Ca2+-binding RTX toxin-like protein